ncbi:MAG: hypothetical protein ACE5Z5_00460 [Candidatus Bathyarchaeia archaeon]
MKRKYLTLVVLLLTITLATAFSATAAFAYDADDDDENKLLIIVINGAYADESDIVVKGLIVCKPGVYVNICFEVRFLSWKRIRSWYVPQSEPVVICTDPVYCDQKLTWYQLTLKDVISDPGWYVTRAFASYNGETAVSNPFVFDPRGGTCGPL